MKLGGKDMLKQAQPHFETFKALFTHGVLGISRSGRPIWVMRVGDPTSVPIRHPRQLCSPYVLA